MMEAIFFRPSSPPSLAIRSRAGMATVSSWMIMELLIYGWMDRAKTVAIEKAEPLMAFIRPRMPVWLSIYCFRDSPSI